MTTRTDASIQMITELLEQRRDLINEDQSMQEFTVKIKFKRGWPFKTVWIYTSTNEKGQ